MVVDLWYRWLLRSCVGLQNKKVVWKKIHKKKNKTPQ